MEVLASVWEAGSKWNTIDWGRVDSAKPTPDRPHMEKARVSSGLA